jgi:hypothetical protein
MPAQTTSPGGWRTSKARLNREPFVIADRLWVKDTLDPEEEKLRFSK